MDPITLLIMATLGAMAGAAPGYQQKLQELQKRNQARNDFARNARRAREAGLFDYGGVFGELARGSERTSVQMRQIAMDSAQAIGRARIGLAGSGLRGNSAADYLGAFERKRLFQEGVANRNLFLLESAAQRNVEAVRRQILARIQSAEYTLVEASGSAIILGSITGAAKGASGAMTGGAPSFPTQAFATSAPPSSSTSLPVSPSSTVVPTGVA